MEQEQAKRAFVAGIKRLKRALDANDAGRDVGNRIEEAEKELDEVGADLWGCHEEIDAPPEILGEIGAQVGDSYHEAVLERSLQKLREARDLSAKDLEQPLYELFVKDQEGNRQTARYRETFYAWLREHGRWAEKIIAADVEG